MSGPVDIEALLRHREFVRRLARRLVRDDARADDVVQETYVAALKNPPRHAGALRAWLATVVRKLAWTQTRSESRRARREQASRPPAAAPRPEDVLERAEWHRRLVNHVMQLREPYRSTLLLRYFEELNSSEIARLHGVPAATVRTRLRRGLEQLRGKLDANDGRTQWLPALVLLAWPDGGPPPPPAPSAWPLAAAAGLGLVAVTALVWYAAATGPGPAERLPPSARTPSGVPPSAPVAPPRRVHTGRWPAPEAGGNFLEVTVLARGRPASGARVVVERLEHRPWHAWAYDPWRLFGRARTDATGRAVLEGVPDGYVRVLAALEGFGRGEAVAFLPAEFEQPVVVDLPPEAPRRVDAVAGAQVEIFEPNGAPWRPELTIPPADGTGRTTIRGVAAGAAAQVRVHAPGFAGYGPRRLPARTLHAELTPLRRTIVWPVAGAGPPPGTRLELRRVHDVAARFRGRVEVGHVVADGLPPGELFELLAIAEDGTFARLSADAGVDTGPPVRFAPPPSLDLRLRDTTGAPVAGVAVRLFHEDVAIYPDERTAAAGRAYLPVFARDPVAVGVRARRHAAFRTVRTYDPLTGDARMEVTLAAARQVSLRVRCDGTPRLPYAYELYTGRTRVAADELVVDRERARLHFRMRPASGDVHLLAPGYLAATVRVEEDDVDVDLIPAGTLVVHVALAAPDKQPYRLALVDDREGERTDLRRGPWSFRLHPGPDHVVRETMMPPGHYRVRDLTSGKATEEFFILPGRGEVQLRLDLQDAWPPRDPVVAGRVTAEGLDLRLAEVVGVSASGDRLRVPVARDGTFVLPWPGPARLEVSAHHPQASAPGPALSLSAPRRDVVLRLRSRHRATARLVPGAAPAAGGTEPRVRLIPAAEGQTPYGLDVSLAEGRLRFDGFRPGRYTLRFDLPGVVPLTLRDVVLADGVTDLGTLNVDPGTALRFRILGREGETVPELTIVARALAAPRYQRSRRTGDAETAVVSGLRAGTFLVSAWERHTGLKVWSRRIDADGTNDVQVEIDLR
ncbi:MAG: RNA polymerase sigma factor [Planctomycetota bacterium]|jgi:RNA polymerase sigma-70 factor (ECF subfamily)